MIANDISITAEISTAGRYFTTLPSAIISVAMQTYRPKELILYDDGEHRDLRGDPMYQYLFGLLDEKKIKWKVGFGKKMGQVLNHQRALEEAQSDWIWRLDDDNIAEPDVLEKLIKNITPKTGAVAGVVLHPNRPIYDLPDFYSINKIEDCQDPTMLNIQWFRQKGIKSVDHLYSTFIYRKEAGKHGYNKDLSPVGHREETLFTYEMKRNGWDLLLDPEAITWHFRFNSGGIRGPYHTKESFDHDEQVFLNKLKEWGVTLRQNKIIVLDAGLGDHLVFKKVIPEIRERYPNQGLVIACCYPEVFKGLDAKIISLQDAINYFGDINRFNFYRWLIEHNWKDSMEDAFRKYCEI
jgi:glycosyltransferase involved in cell wall biosynthesis